MIMFVTAGCGTGQDSFIPTETDQDPALRIPGVQFFEDNASHIPSTERADYDRLRRPAAHTI